MMDANLYVDRVLAQMPPTTPRLSQIASDLRGHIADSLELGEPLESVLAKLGDPSSLAASYMSEVPFASASFGRRLAAKAIDLAAVWSVLAPVVYLTWKYASYRTFSMLTIFLMVVGVFAPLAIYTAIDEFRTGRTLGKRLLGLRVVRDNGLRITLASAIVRQIPVWLQFHVIDGLFALATERNQRAFELLSKTRVIRVIN